MDTWHYILQQCCTASCPGRDDGKCPFRNKKYRKGECEIIQTYIDDHDLHLQLLADSCDIDYESDPLGWLEYMT